MRVGAAEAERVDASDERPCFLEGHRLRDRRDVERCEVDVGIGRTQMDLRRQQVLVLRIMMIFIMIMVR